MSSTDSLGGESNERTRVPTTLSQRESGNRKKSIGEPTIRAGAARARYPIDNGGEGSGWVAGKETIS